MKCPRKVSLKQGIFASLWGMRTNFHAYSEKFIPTNMGFANSIRVRKNHIMGKSSLSSRC